MGFVGNFTATIRKKATYVDKDKCIGCGACYDACPVSVKNQFDYNLSERKAIYVPYTGALPNVPVIDERHCLRMKGESNLCKEALDMGLISKEEYEKYKTEACSLCKQACMFDAINYDDKEETILRDAGGIIVATGFELFDASVLPQFGYGKIPEVYTGLEFERILSQTGPTAGKLLMKDSREPESFAIIHCVGSRDKNHREYCSGICCLYALKFSRLIKKHLPSANVYHVYADWCVPGKDNQAFLDSVKAEENIHFIHTPLPMRADIIQDDKKINILCTDVAGKKREILSDMVILCPAVVPAGDSAITAGILGISQGKDGFFAEGHTKLAPVSTNIEGIYIAGCAQGPKDIQASVAQGAAAAGQVLSTLVPGRKLELEAATAEIDADACSGCMTCIGLCPYKAITFDKEKKVSVINAALCKGCGTCVAACPSASIKSRHFTTEQIFAEIRGGPEIDNFEPKIVAFLCNWCSYAGADAAGSSRKTYAPNVRIIRVMCTGRVEPEFVLKAFQSGADGVLILGCHPGDCHYKEGNYKALRRYYLLRKVLTQFGIEEERLKLDWVSASEADKFVETVNDMVGTIKQLGPLAPSRPVPIDKGVDFQEDRHGKA